MIVKPKHQRLVLVVLAASALIGAVLLAMWGLQDRAAYFDTPSDVAAQRVQADKAMRLGGMVVNGSLIVSVRNLGYSRNAGEFVKRWFGDIGSAGGHRAMAKAVVPIERFRQKFGDLSGPAITARIAEAAEQFLHEPATEKRKETLVR